MGRGIMTNLRMAAAWGCAVLVVFLTGCTTLRETYDDVKGSISGIFGGSDENLTAEELAWAGMEHYDDGNY